MSLAKRLGTAKRCGQRGASSTELAIAAPIFFLLVIGSIDVGRGVWARNTIAYAATAGARWASVRSQESENPATEDQITAAVQSQASALDPTKVTVVPTWTPSNARGSTLRVSVSYDYTPILLTLAQADPVIITYAYSTIVSH